MVISLESNRNIIYYIGPICPCNSNRDNLEVIVIVIILLFCVIDPKSALQCGRWNAIEPITSTKQGRQKARERVDGAVERRC